MSKSTAPQFGWIGPFEAAMAWESLGETFPTFGIFGATERKRTCAWDAWAELGWEINKSVLVRQEIGDCVSFGSAIAVAAVAAHEIVRLKQPEEFKVAFPPYIYGTSRLMPEGGNGRLRGDGSLGSWAANVVRKYGILRADADGVPSYSGSVAKSWGSSKSGFTKFIDEADDHLIREAARITTIDGLIDAVCNGYFCTIASNRGYSMRLKDDRGKSWFTGRATWPHQTSIIAYDDKPEPCVYRRNQWGQNAHGRQLDGPDGGGWCTCESLEGEVRDSGTEIFAYSMFDGFPSQREKPDNWFG